MFVYFQYSIFSIIFQADFFFKNKSALMRGCQVMHTKFSVHLLAASHEGRLKLFGLASINGMFNNSNNLTRAHHLNKV